MNKQIAMREFPSSFKLELHNKIIDHLFTKHRKIIRAKLVKILENHYALVDEVSTKLLFRGTVYSVGNPEDEDGKSRWDKRIPLHDTLHTDMDSYLKESNLLELGAARVGSYMQRSLNMCTTIEDFFVVLPKEVTEFFPASMMEIRHKSKQSIPTEKLNNFLIRNKQGYDYLQQRMMMNLLLTRIE